MYKRKKLCIGTCKSSSPDNIYSWGIPSVNTIAFSAKIRRHRRKTLKLKANNFLFQKVSSFICLIESTVQSKIIHQIKRERLLSQHIKVKRLYPIDAKRRKMSNSTSKMGENIWSHLTTVYKNFVLHEVIVITAYYTLLVPQWKGKFQTQLTMTGFYRAVTTLHSCIAWWETRSTRDIKNLVYVRPFSLGISLHWERNRNKCL